MLDRSVQSFDYNTDRLYFFSTLLLEELPFLSDVCVTFCYGRVLLKHVLNMSVVKYNWHLVSVPFEKALVIYSQWCTGASSTFHMTSLKFMLKQSEISLRLLSSSFVINLSMTELSFGLSNFSHLVIVLTFFFSCDIALLYLLWSSLLHVWGAQHVEKMLCSNFSTANDT